MDLLSYILSSNSKSWFANERMHIERKRIEALILILHFKTDFEIYWIFLLDIIWWAPHSAGILQFVPQKNSDYGQYDQTQRKEPSKQTIEKCVTADSRSEKEKIMKKKHEQNIIEEICYHKSLLGK